MHNTFQPGFSATSIWLGKQDHLSAGHSGAIVGISCNLELVELVTIKFIDEIDFTVIVVALGGTYNVKQLVGITKLVCSSPRALSFFASNLHRHAHSGRVMPLGCCVEWICCLELVSFLTCTHASSAFTHTSVNKLNIQLLVRLSLCHLDFFLKNTVLFDIFVTSLHTVNNICVAIRFPDEVSLIFCICKELIAPLADADSFFWLSLLDKMHCCLFLTVFAAVRDNTAHAAECKRFNTFKYFSIRCS